MNTSRKDEKLLLISLEKPVYTLIKVYKDELKLYIKVIMFKNNVKQIA
jgi:hypothetical protein